SRRAGRAFRRHALWSCLQHGGRYHYCRLAPGARRSEGDSRGRPDAAARAAPLDLALGLLPEGFHFLEAGLGRFPTLTSQAAFDIPEAALELVIGGTQGSLRVDLAVTREVGDGEQDVAQFVCGTRLIDLAGG